MKSSKAHFERVAALACAVAEDWGHECGGRITCHHPIGIEWRGMGQKAPDDCVIPLCDNHHQHSRNAIHMMGKKPWEKKYGSQRELLEATREKLGASGLKVPGST
ncbi:MULTISPECIES: DUF968 domain-containing protein [Rhizobium/Agrobacterium group]|uniref:DUF968 domain-containing protein n=1 Tax=Agrobacterium pusense TaxID=648995 RepID=UPI0009BA1665